MEVPAMRRSVKTLAVAVAVAAAIPMVAVATPAQAALPPVGLVIPILAPMLPGQSGWVSALWGTLTDVCNVRATASGAGLTVSYPSNTGTYSSLYKQDSLAAGHLDYTAFKLTVDPGIDNVLSLKINMSYVERSATSGANCEGTKREVAVNASLPVVASSAAVVQKTTSVTVSQNTPIWTQLTFAGKKTGLDNFQVQLTPPAGLAVSYPGSKTTAGLNDAATLAVGDDDFVAVKVDATGAKPGSYKVPVRATYTGGSYDGSLTVVVN
jgi:hypothetical protein